MLTRIKYLNGYEAGNIYEGILSQDGTKLYISTDVVMDTEFGIVLEKDWKDVDIVGRVGDEMVLQPVLMDGNYGESFRVNADLFT